MTTSKTTETAPTTKIRIVFQGECNKLTARGQGKLSYELGVNDTTDEKFIRIAANSQGGTCSFEWINLQTIENMLDSREPEELNFSAIFFRKAFVSRSANNHGYLAAILKAENVIGNVLEQSTQLASLSFDGIKEKISSLQREGIDLTDHVAESLRIREEKKAARKAEKVATVKVKDADVKVKPDRKKTGKATG